MKAEKVQIDQVFMDPANARTHPQKNMEAIRGSLQRFGQQKPIVIDQKGCVIAGNGTLMAAQQLGWQTIEAVRTTLEGAQAAAFAIADNRTAELAEWDEQALMQTLTALDLEDPTLLDAAGFDKQSLEAMINGLLPDEPAEGLTDPDEVPEQCETRCQPGDLWQLGDHRLLCGDSTKPADVERLMGGDKADLCFTSPPYGLEKQKKTRRTKRSNTKLGPALAGNAYVDFVSEPVSWINLMRDWFDASNQFVEYAWLINIQMLANNKRELLSFMHEHSDRFIDLAIWDKGSVQPAMAPGVLNSAFEMLILMSKQSGASRKVPLASWRGDQSNIYRGDFQRSNEHFKIHGATMPIHLPIWAMSEICDQARSVYEPFCGTGTTLIAAEQLKRRCYGIEIATTYCDVILTRWEQFTGQKAEKLDG